MRNRCVCVTSRLIDEINCVQLCATHFTTSDEMSDAYNRAIDFITSVVMEKDHLDVINFNQLVDKLIWLFNAPPQPPQPTTGLPPTTSLPSRWGQPPVSQQRQPLTVYGRSNYCGDVGYEPRKSAAHASPWSYASVAARQPPPPPPRQIQPIAKPPVELVQKSEVFQKRSKLVARTQTYCLFCMDAGFAKQVYKSHLMYDPFGKLTCPNLAARDFGCGRHG